MLICEMSGGNERHANHGIVCRAIEGILGSIAASRVSNLDEEKAAIQSILERAGILARV